MKNTPIHLVWLCVAAATLLIGTTLSTTHVVERPIEVIKEVPKEVERLVEKRVEVPAPLTDYQKEALALYYKFISSQSVGSDQTLHGIKSVRVAIIIADQLRPIISEEEIRTKFEITLRRNGVVIDPSSPYRLSFLVSGLVYNETDLVIHADRTQLSEQVYIIGDNGSATPVLTTFATTWDDPGKFGNASIENAREVELGNTETAAEKFSNDWLAANPKK